MSAQDADKSGTLFALGAYSLWGLFPIYWKWLGHFSSLEILAERMVWSFLFYWMLTLWREKHGLAWIKLFVHRSTRQPIILASLLIACNWVIFIWAVNNGYVLETSLGYFLTPLLNVLIGRVALKEQLSRARWVAIGFATLGVVVMTLQAERFPWISLVLGGTFAIYGLIRKRLEVSVFQVSTAETFVLFLPAVIAAFYFRSVATSTATLMDWTLFIGSGIVTGLPLFWFANAARRLPLSTLGFFQYIAPTIQFLLAVFIYHEPFALPRFTAFVLIWSALGIFTWESVKKRRRGL